MDDRHAFGNGGNEERDYFGVDPSKEVEGSFRDEVGNKVVPDSVGSIFENDKEGLLPHVGLGFVSAKLGRVGHKKSVSGSKIRRTQAHSVNGNSPIDARPKKRSRWDMEVTEPGFGFVGFTSASENVR
ncbi:hypothetical protein Hanom_Chr15g01373401 [Helianthus anomalus]